ncbi:hypothetical protein Tco_1274117 [Tanacetum coccineum]
MVISDDEEDLVLEYSSKQGRMIKDIDQDDDITLITPTKIGHDEELAQKLYADELAKAAAREEQERFINWSDPAVLRYHAIQNRPLSKDEVRKNMCTYLKNQGGYKQSQFKGMSYEDIRPIFEIVWDQNHAFVPIDSAIEKEVIKRYGITLQKQSAEEEKEKEKEA